MYELSVTRLHIDSSYYDVSVVCVYLHSRLVYLGLTAVKSTELTTNDAGPTAEPCTVLAVMCCNVATFHLQISMLCFTFCTFWNCEAYYN